MNDEILDSFHREEIRQKYSLLQIVIFSAIFSPLFGAVLMAMNLQQLTFKISCIVSGVALAVACVGLIYYFDLRYYLALSMFLVGGYAIKTFWKKYEFHDRNYERRSWIPPLVVGFGIGCLVFILGIGMMGDRVNKTSGFLLPLTNTTGRPDSYLPDDAHGSKTLSGMRRTDQGTAGQEILRRPMPCDV